MKPITDVHALFRYQRAIRNFTTEEVPDELVARVLTAAIHGTVGPARHGSYNAAEVFIRQAVQHPHGAPDSL